MAGGQYVSASVGEALALTVRTGSISCRTSDCRIGEYEVLCLIASGQTVSDIAESIHLSVTTISTYRARILDKMNFEEQCGADPVCPSSNMDRCLTALVRLECVDRTMTNRHCFIVTHE